MNAKTNKSKSPFRRHALHLAVLTLLYPAVLPANPTGAQVISGQVSIDQSVAGITTVTNTPNAIINWQDFNIAQNEITRFIQQNGQSAVLNRIIGGNPSEILGSLFSNGQVFLINPNGVIFGAGATIDTQGLIASSLNLSDSDFQRGNFHFVAGSKSGDISNEGIIHAGKDGNIVLIAPNIENKGIIQSDGGKITLAAGQELILTSMDEPDIRFQVQAPQNQALNIGQLLTDGGAINVFAGSIKHSGDISANSVSVNKQGDIHLIAKDNVTLESGSKISTNNAGKVVVLSDNETHAHGEISATGGFVETSGKKLDTAGIQVKARDWLLDPYDILIIDQTNPNVVSLPTPTGNPLATSFTTPSTQSTLLTSDIENALNLGSNVTIATTNVSGADLGNITVASNIRKNMGADSTFTLKADNAIIIQPDVTIEAIDAGTGKLNIVLNTGNGNIQLNAGATLNSNGGNIILGGGTCITTSCDQSAKGHGSDENQVEGITLSNAKLNSAGGNIFLKGEGVSGTGVSNATGILINESKIDSGTGSITIQGSGGNGTYDTANDIGGENNSGVVITGTQSYPSFISSTGAISIVASNLNSSTTLDSLIFENAGIRGGQLTLNATTSLNNTMLEATASDISLTGSFSSISGFAVLKTGTIAGSPWVNGLSGANLLYSSANVPVNPTGVYVVYREAYPTPPPPPVEPVIVHPTPEEIEAARLAAEKLAAEEKAKLEAEKLAAEKAKLEAEKLAAEEKAKLEAEKLAAEEKAKLEAEKLAAEEKAKLEAEKLAAEEKAKLEAEKLAAEKAKLEAEKLAAEKAKLEAEKLAAEKAKLEAEKLAAEKAKLEAEKLAAEEKAKLEAEKLAAEKAKLEAEKLAAEKAKLEAEKLAAEKAKLEAEKLAAEAAKAEAERLAAEAAKAEAERLAAEAAKAEAERLAAEAAKAEAERLAAEAAKAEAERLAAEAAKAEAERLAAEAAKAEAERLAAEAAKAEAERLAAEAAKAEAERLAAEARAKTTNPVVFDTIASIAEDLTPKEAEKIVENIDNTAKQQMGAVILNSGTQSSSSANLNQTPPPPPPESQPAKQESSASDKPDDKKTKTTQIAAVTTSETKTPQPLQQCK